MLTSVGLSRKSSEAQRNALLVFPRTEVAEIGQCNRLHKSIKRNVLIHQNESDVVASRIRLITRMWQASLNKCGTLRCSRYTSDKHVERHEVISENKS